MPILEMTVNGKAVVLEVDGLRPLADVLREELHLTGTKIGCREGECGACTVLLDGQAVNSCMVPAMKAHGCRVLTIEGLGNIESPHKLQKAITDAGGVQCGYCTPGFVLSAAALLEQTPQPTVDEIQEALAGNLCRCTGYKRIIQGILDVASEVQPESRSRPRG